MLRTGFVWGWACALLAAVITIAVDSSFESQTLAGGYHLKIGGILGIVGGAALAGFLAGAFSATPVNKD